MEATCKFTNAPTSFPLLPRNSRPPFSTPFSSISFRTAPPPSSVSSIKATSSSSSHPHLPAKPRVYEFLNQFPSSLVRTTLIAGVTATALFFARFNLKPVIAAPIFPVPTVESDSEEEPLKAEMEKTVEDYLNSNPDDVETLLVLYKLRVRNSKVKEAIPILERLMSLVPDHLDLQLAKAHTHMLAGEPNLAKLGFKDVLSKDPLCVDAYHGLLLMASENDSSTELKEIGRRIVEAIEKCKKDKKESNKNVLRELKIVLAQVHVLEEVFDAALKVYEELVKEEPRDFRPYLGEGIVYALLGKREESEKSFNKYRRLVPKGHPYAKHFDREMMEKLLMRKVDLNTKPKLVGPNVINFSKNKVEVEVIGNDLESSKIEEQTIEDEISDSKTKEQLIEDDIVASEDVEKSSEAEEKMVENERASPEEKMVENERASPDSEE